MCFFAPVKSFGRSNQWICFKNHNNDVRRRKLSDEWRWKYKSKSNSWIRRRYDTQIIISNYSCTTKILFYYFFLYKYLSRNFCFCFQQYIFFLFIATEKDASLPLKQRQLGRRTQYIKTKRDSTDESMEHVSSIDLK